MHARPEDGQAVHEVRFSSCLRRTAQASGRGKSCAVLPRVSFHLLGAGFKETPSKTEEGESLRTTKMWSASFKHRTLRGSVLLLSDVCAALAFAASQICSAAADSGLELPCPRMKNAAMYRKRYKPQTSV